MSEADYRTQHSEASGQGQGAQKGKPWFRPRKFGPGGIPQTWQGWVVVVAVVTVIVGVRLLFVFHVL